MLAKWLKKHNVEDLSKILKAIGQKIKSDGDSTVVCIGFCWGAWILLRAMKLGFQPDAIAAISPSLRFEELGGGRLSDLISVVNLPLLMITAGNDPENLKPYNKLHRQLLLQKDNKAVTFKEFVSMKHGWAIRGDMNDSRVLQDTHCTICMICQFLNSIN